MDELEDFSKKYNIDIVTIAEIIAYRRSNERMIERVAEARLPTIYGEFTAVSYKSMVDKDEHVALIMGDINKNSLLEIWNSDKYRKFRQKHFEMPEDLKCTNNCDAKMIGSYVEKN